MMGLFFTDYASQSRKIIQQLEQVTNKKISAFLIKNTLLNTP
jgi:hypothetical protein